MSYNKLEIRKPSCGAKAKGRKIFGKNESVNWFCKKKKKRRGQDRALKLFTSFEEYGAEHSAALRSVVILQRLRND